MRHYDIQPTAERPRGYRLELHVLGCDCQACEAQRPAPAPPLTAMEIGRIAIAAVVIGHLLAALIWGPATVAHVLWADLTGARL